MMKLVVATGNSGKLREFETALTSANIEVVGLDTLQDRSPIEETATTFEGNARLKAEGYSLGTDLAVLADDSGLEVDALNGAPGVHSARYGSPDLTDKARYRALLKALTDVPERNRTATFRSVIAIARAGKTLATFEGRAEGTIVRKPKGSNGFGYDPIFFQAEMGKTFAELSAEEKQARSHRGAAIQKLLAALRSRELVLG